MALLVTADSVQFGTQLLSACGAGILSLAGHGGTKSFLWAPISKIAEYSYPDANASRYEAERLTAQC